VQLNDSRIKPIESWVIVYVRVKLTVLSGECGHIHIPPNCDEHPDSEPEHDRLQHISNHGYNPTQRPEYEKIASGGSLPLCPGDQILVERETGESISIESRDASVIARKAKKASDDIGRLALLWHCKMLVRGAKAIATAMYCDSIVFR
jgi:glucokinase